MMAFFPGSERKLPCEVDARYLAGRDLILSQRQSQTYKVIARWFEADGIELRPIMELANTEAIKTLVAAGIGVGVLPLERKQGILVYGRTQVRPLRPVLVRELAIVRRREDSQEPALQFVLAALRALSTRTPSRTVGSSSAAPVESPGRAAVQEKSGQHHVATKIVRLK